MKKAKKDKYERIDQPEPERADHSTHIKRLNRVVGQIEGVQNMLRNGRDVDAVLMQLKAAQAALKSAERQLLEHYLDVAVDEIAMGGRKTRDRTIAELIELYRPI